MTDTAIIPLILVILILTRIKRVINRFLNSGTISFQTAKTLEELKYYPGFILNHLIQQEVIIQARRDQYYLDEENLKLYTKRIRLISITLLSLILIFLIIGNILFRI